MNSTLKNLLENQEPKIPTLNEKERMLYKAGLGTLGILVCEEFFNIPKLPSARFDTDGLFYTLPYYDDDQLWSSGNQRTLLVVWKVENRSSFCPLRIEFDIKDEDNFVITVYDQSGDKTIKKELISREAGKCYTQIPDYAKLKLTDLLNLEEVGIK